MIYGQVDSTYKVATSEYGTTINYRVLNDDADHYPVLTAGVGIGQVAAYDNTGFTICPELSLRIKKKHSIQVISQIPFWILDESKTQSTDIIFNTAVFSKKKKRPAIIGLSYNGSKYNLYGEELMSRLSFLVSGGLNSVTILGSEEIYHNVDDGGKYFIYEFERLEFKNLLIGTYVESIKNHRFEIDGSTTIRRSRTKFGVDFLLNMNNTITHNITASSASLASDELPSAAYKLIRTGVRFNFEQIITSFTSKNYITGYGFTMGTLPRVTGPDDDWERGFKNVFLQMRLFAMLAK